MRTTAFWTLYVGITILIGSVCHYHTAVEGRPGKSPAGKTVVTKDRTNNRRKNGLKVRRTKTAHDIIQERTRQDGQDTNLSNHDYSEDLDYVEPCVGVCQYHREQKWKRDNGITDPPTTTSTTLDPADRTTKDYGRNAKEIGRGSAVPGAWPGRSPGIYIGAVSSILTATVSSCLLGSQASQQLYFSGGGKWIHSLNPL